MCKECERRGKTWDGDDPQCAFNVDGKFKTDMYELGDNYRCATLDIIRDFMYDERKFSWSEEQSVGFISHKGVTITLGWYKDRGRTEELHIFGRAFSNMSSLTDLEVCERMITNKINVLSDGE